MSFWKEILDKLESSGPGGPEKEAYPAVNTHIHTPYSYSAFDSIDSIIETAGKEKIAVLGINDFNTTDGFDEWAGKCISAGIFPLFNMEMIGLDRKSRDNGLKINDPNNPGRIYISGKGLRYPVKMSEQSMQMLNNVRDMSNEHVRKMTHKLNDLTRNIDNRLLIDFDEMLRDHTKGMVRERHLARLLRIKAEKIYPDPRQRRAFYTELTGNHAGDIDVTNSEQTEIFIRSALLKSGGAAFVEESPEIFIEPEEIRDIILDTGGIPTYPFLADYKDGRYTDFESDKEKASGRLMEQGFFSAEFIPGRNDYALFREYVLYLHGKGFIITFGTEHNSPGKKPVEVFGGGNTRLDDELLKINYEGACIIAAHQYLSATEGAGYLDDRGTPKTAKKEKFINLGERLIRSTS